MDIVNSPTVSVVIASIGRSSLYETLDSIAAWKVRVIEVIVVLPQHSSFEILRSYSTLNIRIVKRGAGQVAQRAFGFAIAVGSIVVQSDDDVTIDSNSIVELVLLAQSTQCSAAPVLYTLQSKAPFFRYPTTRFGKSKEEFLSVCLGFPRGTQRMGKISSSGVAAGVDPMLMDKNVAEVDWLPGVLIAHNRKNLVHENYFPFHGRACHEDLIHSLLLREKGVSLVICRGAAAFTKVDLSEISFKSVVRELQILHYVVRRFKLSKSRFSFWVAYRLLTFGVKFALRARL